MDGVVRALLLGIVQGLTEFLPVSSSGHLVLVREIFNWPDEGLAFDAVLHLGTLLAVLIVFRATWRELLRGRAPRLLRAVVLGTIPAAIVGFLGRSVIASEFRTLAAIGLGFFATALVLRIADRFVAVRPSTPLGATLSLSKGRPSAERAPALADLPTTAAVLIGVAQAVALVPGVSRAGMTIAAGLFLGLSRRQSVEFSFLLSAPILAGAGLDSLRSIGTTDPALLAPLGAGFLASAVVGAAAMQFLLRSIRVRTFTPYVLYLAVVGFLLLLRG